MSPRSLTDLYDRLTAEERFALFLGALDRGDDDELERLSESCPTMVYEMREIGFTSRVTTGRDVVLEMTVLLARLLTDVTLALWESLSNPDPEHSRAPAEPGELEGMPVGDEGNDPHSAPPRRNRGERDDVNLAASRLKGVCAGIVAFCAEIGIEPDCLFKLAPLCLDVWTTASTLDLEAPVDAEWRESFENFLKNIWSESVHDLPRDRLF